MSKKHLFIDFEASSLSQDSYPVAIGVFDSENEDNCYNCLIKPEGDWDDWSEESEMIHGYSIEELMFYGQDAKTVAQEINALYEDETLLCDSQWDIFWMGRLYDAAEMKPSFLLTNMRHILDKETMQKIDDEIDLVSMPHDPLQDAKILAGIAEEYLP